jgi:uncharacterized membrane protein
MKRVENIFVVIVIAVSVIIVTFSKEYFKDIKPQKYFEQDFVVGTILEVLDEKIEVDEFVESRYIGVQKVKVRVEEGKLKGREFIISNTLSKRHNIYAKKNLKVILTIRKSDGKNIVWIYNYQRSKYIHCLMAIFFGLIVLLGGKKGFKSLVALCFTIVMIVFILIPMLFGGYEPIPLAVFVSGIIIFVSFFLVGGINTKSMIAIFGTFFGIITASILSYIFGKISMLSGINMENGEQVLYLAQDYRIKIKGFMFISILIASLGAVMDVSMSIASAANELIFNNEEIEEKTLFASLMNIGRDMMGTMTNTLILAFAGSSFTLIMMIWGYQMAYTQLINIPMIAIEAIQSFAGSIGIILTVPFTAFMATVSLKYRRRKANENEKVTS